MKIFIVIFFVMLNISQTYADIVNFDLAGRIYTKWLYRNNDSQGVLSYGNPFWPDDIAGDNGTASEFELKIFGKVSDYVQTYVRLQSRFGGLWHDWWESGERKHEYKGEVNTSGDTLGMNRAEYIKLRAVQVRMALPIPTIDWVTIGSSDLGMFNPWSIGKVRYIDRDNGKGIFFDGHIAEDILNYNISIIALPKLWVGPWWSTGIGDPELTNPFYAQDWAYGLKLNPSPLPSVNLTLISTLTNDIEIDLTEPEAIGSKYPTCKDDLGNEIPDCKERKDYAVDYYTRYLNSVTTFEAQIEPTSDISLNIFGGYSIGRLDPQLTANAVQLNNGFSPIVYKDVKDYAVKIRGEWNDPFSLGVSFKGEYFNIGDDWNSIFGARREEDVLLTDGFIEGGQLPTLNLANEFIDFDEDFFESCIGWHGGTFILDYLYDTFELSGEVTYITYNTNMQGRDVENTYPDFLHTDGFTDTDIYDYANITDRGRDPRSVYKENQNRKTFIGVLNAKYLFDIGRGLEFGFKFKYIKDMDYRITKYSVEHPLFTNLKEDDYDGNIFIFRPKIGYYLTDGLKLEIGGQIDYWDEKNRKGTPEQGYGDDKTKKEKIFTVLTYDFYGVKFKYYFEYIHKLQHRQREEDQKWNVFRSKASLEVNW